jgi:hypothetical protein
MSRRLLLALPLAMTACGEETKEEAKTHRLTVYGEAYIEDRIPAGDTDGWTVDFEAFLVAVGDVKAGDTDVGGQRVFDLARSSGGTGHLFADAADGPFDTLEYRVAPAAGASAGNATAAQVERMNQGGHSVWVSGTATKGGETRTFAWGFDTDTRYFGCHAEPADVGDGTVRSVFTIHADHLFYDDLVSEAPNVAFQLVADADADGDGEVTRAELEAVDITGLDRYQVGNADDVTDLWRFIEAQTRTLGHIDGEGHCDSE